MTERGLKNSNVFYSSFTNVFYFCHVFLRFLTFFIFFLERFFYIFGINDSVYNFECHSTATRRYTKQLSTVT